MNHYTGNITPGKSPTTSGSVKNGITLYKQFYLRGMVLVISISH